jgi:muramidase (phage lysozyme)
MTISPTLARFLALIGYSEGADYNTIVSGPDGPETFSDFSQHPFTRKPAKLVRKGLYSTAAGRYQILYRFWVPYQEMLHLPDFGPDSQDQVAVRMIKECGALDDIANGDVQTAILKCSSRWASFPGSTAGQGGRSMPWLLEKWQELNKENV